METTEFELKIRKGQCRTEKDLLFLKSAVFFFLSEEKENGQFTAVMRM